MDRSQILKMLQNTELYTRIQEIESMYKDLESKQSKFCNEFDIHCKSGCGHCCEHFIPDVSTLEADYLAFGIVSEGKDEVANNLSTFDVSRGYCPFYNWDDQEHHCMVYKYRPLICRLFGASASMNKHGLPVYKKCKWNTQSHDVSASEFEKYPGDVVVMGDYGLELNDFEADDQETVLLHKAVLNSIMKIKLMLQLEHESQN